MESLLLKNGQFLKGDVTYLFPPEKVSETCCIDKGHRALFFVLLTIFAFYFLPTTTLFAKSVQQSPEKVLSFSPASLTFTSVFRGHAPGKVATLSASTGTPTVSLTQSPGSGWLIPQQASTVGLVGFSVSTAGLAVGSYNATVTVASPGYTSATLPVTLHITAIEPALVLTDIGDKITIVGQELTFTATAQANENQVKTFSLVHAPAGATIGASSGTFRWTPGATGEFTFSVRVSTEGSPGLSDEEEITVKVLDLTTNDRLRINAGGPDFMASGNRQFVADQYFSGIDRTSGISGGDILGTTDDALYRSGRCSEAFNYDIPVRNGNYNIVLHFAEIWFGAPGGGLGGAGRRKFSVGIENSLKFQDYDIYAKAGGALRAIKETIPVTVKDGTLNIEFMKGSADMPRVAAIEVLLINPVPRIVVPPIADAFVRDGAYAGVNYGSDPALEIKSADEAGLSRSSYFKFSLEGITQVTSAKLRVFGQNFQDADHVWAAAFPVNNDNWTENGITWNNAPAASGGSLGSVEVGNAPAFYEVDVTNFIRSQLDGNKVASILLKDANGRNKRLIFSSRETSPNPPELVVYSAGPPISGSRMSGEISAENFDQQEVGSVVYPNPVRSRFTLEIGSQHDRNISLDVVHQNGRSYKIGIPNQCKPGSKTEVDISGLSLSTGIYLLEVQSTTATERIKMLVVE